MKENKSLELKVNKVSDKFYSHLRIDGNYPKEFFDKIKPLLKELYDNSSKIDYWAYKKGDKDLSVETDKIIGRIRSKFKNPIYMQPTELPEESFEVLCNRMHDLAEEVVDILIQYDSIYLKCQINNLEYIFKNKSGPYYVYLWKTFGRWMKILFP